MTGFNTASTECTHSLLRIATGILAAALALPSCLASAQSTAPAPSPAAAPGQLPEKKAPAPKSPAPSTSAAATTPATPPDRGAAYYHYTLAHIYEDSATASGRPDMATQAVEEYKLALNADPSSPFLNNGLAELYFKVGRVRDAVLAAQENVKKSPNDLAAHKLLGRIYLRSLGDLQGGQSNQMLQLAIDEFQRIVQLDPGNIENHLLLGQLYTVNHDSAKAEAEFKAAQGIDPNSEEVVLNLARLYTEESDLPHAVQVLKSVPETDRSAKIELALGGTYDQLKDTHSAIAAYRRALDLESDNLDAQRGLAHDLLADNQMDEALKQYREVSAADPQDGEAYLRIAEIERRKGHYEQALSTLQKAQPLAPESLEIPYNIALTYDALGRYDDATKSLEKLLEDTSHANGAYDDREKGNRSFFLERLALIYREQNKTDQAVAAYRSMIALGGEYQVRGYQGVVESYRDAKQWSQATAAAKDAAAKLPNDRSIQLTLAVQLADTGKPDESIQLAKAQAKTPAEQREVALTLSQIFTRLRRWSEAREQLDIAAKLSTKPEDIQAVYFLTGALDEKQKHFDAAEEQFRKILSSDPANTPTLNYLGYMLADRGVKLDEALTMLRKAVELDPQDGAYLDSLGWAYFKLGQYALAEENLLKASQRISTDPTVHDHLGELYEKTGRLKQAVEQWDRSLQEYSRSLAADSDPGDITKVQKKLETAKVKLASSGNKPGVSKVESPQ